MLLELKHKVIAIILNIWAQFFYFNIISLASCLLIATSSITHQTKHNQTIKLLQTMKYINMWFLSRLICIYTMQIQQLSYC